MPGFIFMSDTLDLACHTCKVYLWIGQCRYSTPQGFLAEGSYIYTTDEYIKTLTEFLFSHETHNLGTYREKNQTYDYLDVGDNVSNV